jgi:hypothetical protein
MNRRDIPFPLPKAIGSKPAEVRRYWASLKRGGNAIPFSDDLRLTALPDLAPALVVIDVFALPQRFRLNVVGEDWRCDTATDVAGRFLDEVQPAFGFEFLQSQCAATVESGKPTWYGPRDAARRGEKTPLYERLLLPMWCDGRINMILGVIHRRQIHR